MLDNITKLIKTHISKLILLFIGFFIVSSVYADSSTWHFTSSTDYTYSSSTGFTISWTIASLNKNTLVHTWVITNATNYNWAYDVVVDWNFAYMTNFLWNRVSVLNISNPSAPTLVWSVIDSWTTFLVWVAWIVKDWNYLYVASNTDDAIQVIDVSNPATPTVVWSVRNTTNLNWARWVAKSWNYLFVANDVRDSVAVVNVTNPTTPTYVAEIRNATSLNWAREIKIVWNYAYVTWYTWDRFTVVNITTPTAPTIAWSIWQISWVNLQNWQEFTLASLSSSNNIPTNITLSNSTINENVAIWSTVWTLSTTDEDSWDSHTYSLVTWIGDDDNISFTIVWSSLRTAEIPDYEIKTSYIVRIQTDDWNGWTYQKQFTINISNLWETINSILDFETPGKYTVTSWNWSRLTTNPYENLYSIWSDNWWLPNTQSCFEVNNTFSQTWTITFRYYVSSAATDYLRFYIDNVDTQAWSGTVPWTLYTNTTIAPGLHTYKWCYIKDWATNAGTDNAYVDYITFANSTDTDAPVISNFNYASWFLLPWWNHTLVVNYLDGESWVNTSTDVVALYKWNWTAWGSDISATWLNLASKTVSETQATYPTNNLSYWKYNFTFQISDNYTNSSSTWTIFYIDEPEIIISTWSFDLGDLSYNDGLSFSDNEIIATIRTVWAPFELQMSKDSDFDNALWSIIIDWDWSVWVWYDKNPYTLVNKNINNNPIVCSGALNINVNWAKNEYTFPIKIGTLIPEQTAAWSYDMTISFRAVFGY